MMMMMMTITVKGAWGGVVVKALRYSRWCHWIFQ